MAECYAHPGSEAAATCVACARPVCGECREDVAGHAMCRACVAATQERLGAEAAPAGNDAPAADSAVAAPDLAGFPASAAPAGCELKQYLKAFAYGLGAAVAGAIIWDKLVFWTHYQIGFVAVILGAIVGMAVRAGSDGRPGRLLPWMGALLAGFSVILGYVLLVNDQASTNAEAAANLARIPAVLRFVLLAVIAVRSMDLMDWVFVAIGVWEGWSIPRKAMTEVPAAPAAPVTRPPMRGAEQDALKPTAERLPGRWVTDPWDTESLMAAGTTTVEIREDGHLAYISGLGEQAERTLMTYRIGREQIIASHPEPPHERAIPFWFTPEGHLVLDYAGRLTRYVRGGEAPDGEDS
jgi:hypothetical protein